MKETEVENLRFPDDITEFFKKERLVFTVEDLDMYTSDNGIIDNGIIITNSNEVLLKWEFDGKDCSVSGTYIDNL